MFFEGLGTFLVVIIILVIVLAIVSSCVRIVPQARALVVERLGGYLGTYGVGLHILVPFIDRVARKVDLREQVEDFPPQPVITKDNVTMMIDTVVFYYITDPKLYAYGVERPLQAIENLTATTLRNIIGDLELDETLTSRETINAKMQEYCQENRWYYLNVAEVFKDENGYLKLEYCSDRNSMGMHFTYDGAKVWVNYLKTHIPEDLL